MSKKSMGVGGGFGAGVKPKYKEEYVAIAYKLSLLGLTNAEMATFLEVHRATFDRWLANYPELKQATKAGKTMADAEAAEGLHKRTKGYKYKEVTKEMKLGKMTITKEVEKELPPDASAALSWLKNRQRGKWADQQQLEVKFAQELTDEELEERTKKLIEKAKKT